jgi:hypothetical protein
MIVVLRACLPAREGSAQDSPWRATRTSTVRTCLRTLAGRVAPRRVERRKKGFASGTRRGATSVKVAKHVLRPRS